MEFPDKNFSASSKLSLYKFFEIWNECLVIEDSTNGIKAASNAGIYCIGFESHNSKNQDYSKADLVVKNFNQIYFNKIKTLF